MSTKLVAQRDALQDAAKLINTQHGCGPVQFAGTSEALYERHLLFDSGVDLASDAEYECNRVRGPCRCWLAWIRTGHDEISAPSHLCVAATTETPCVEDLA